MAVIAVIAIACCIGISVVRTALEQMDNSVDSRERAAELYTKGLDGKGKPLDRGKLKRGKAVFDAGVNSELWGKPGSREAVGYYTSNEYWPSSYAEQLKDPEAKKRWKEQKIKDQRKRSNEEWRNSLQMGILVIAVAVGITIGGFIYFLPTIIAKRRRKDNLQAIFVCNLFAFVFGVPWLVAMVWAFTDEKKSTTMPPPIPLEREIDVRIRRLYELKVEGILSDEEFEKKKNELLGKI